MKIEWKGAELSAKMMGKVPHKFFKYFVNGLNNSFPYLVELGSVVSHFIQAPRNFA